MPAISTITPRVAAADARKQSIRDRVQVHARFIFPFLSRARSHVVDKLEVRSTKISRYSFVRRFIRARRFANLFARLSERQHMTRVTSQCHLKFATKIMFTCAMTFISRSTRREK